MRCRYKFPIRGRVRTSKSFQIPSNGFFFEPIQSEEGFLTHVSVTIPIDNKALWPIVQQNPAPGVKLHINLTSPFFEVVKRDIRAIEGILSLFGSDGIDIEAMEEDWLPDSEEERSELSLYGFKRNKLEVAATELPEVPFDLIARSFLVARDTWDIETALNFFRKGRVDVKAGNYIEAIYHFFFLLESLFAAGKFKSDQVEDKFCANAKLLKHIEAATQDASLAWNLSGDQRIQAAYDATYKDKSPPEVISHIVKLRGFLHHHSKDRKDIWHPDEHVRFGADAYFLQHVCFAVAFSLVEHHVFSKKTALKYDLILKAQGIK